MYSANPRFCVVVLEELILEIFPFLPELNQVFRHAMAGLLITTARCSNLHHAVRERSPVLPASHMRGICHAQSLHNSCCTDICVLR